MRSNFGSIGKVHGNGLAEVLRYAQIICLHLLYYLLTVDEEADDEVKFV
jgi:hypothetical protein